MIHWSSLASLEEATVRSDIKDMESLAVVALVLLLCLVIAMSGLFDLVTRQVLPWSVATTVEPQAAELWE